MINVLCVIVLAFNGYFFLNYGHKFFGTFELILSFIVAVMTIIEKII